MDFHRSTFLIALIGLSLMAQHTWAGDLEHRVYLGLWSDHWYNDSPEYNESNQVVQYSLYNPVQYGKEAITVATFINSHFDRTWALGYGQEYPVIFVPDIKFGWQVGVMYGYGDKLATNWNGISPTVQFHFKYDVLKVQIMGPAINVGLEGTF